MEIPSLSHIYLHGQRDGRIGAVHGYRHSKPKVAKKVLTAIMDKSSKKS
jgi:hypothetical protein